MRMKIYLVWCPGHNETAKHARPLAALSAALACEDWADSDDAYQDTFEIANGKNATVCVVEEGSALPPEEYIVTGEMQRTYCARPMQERDTSNDLHEGDAP